MKNSQYINQASGTRCQHCKHLATPGIGVAHCGARKDTPPAYGANHPLHKLPDDMGINCQMFEARE